MSWWKYWGIRELRDEGDDKKKKQRGKSHWLSVLGGLTSCWALPAGSHGETEREVVCLAML